MSDPQIAEKVARLRCLICNKKTSNYPAICDRCDQRSAETAARVKGGYVYREHFIERAANRQWNVYPEGAVYPDVVAEGCRSLAEAKVVVDSRFPPPLAADGDADV